MGLRPHRERDGEALRRPLVFRGGSWSALVPFLVFLGGVAYIALSGSPDEKAFWPVLLTAIAVGILLVLVPRLWPIGP